MRLLLCLALVIATPAFGATWQPGLEEVPIPGLSVSLGDGQPVAVGEDGRMFVVFQNIVDDTTMGVGCIVRMPDCTWLPPELLSVGGIARSPSVSVGRDGRAHVLWEDRTDGEGDIVYRVRGVDGTWSEAVMISPAAGASRDPVLAVDAFDHVHAVWVDARAGVSQILHSVLPPGGAWEGPTVLSDEADSPDQPSMDADALGGVHVVWLQRVGSVRTGLSSEIFYLHIEAMEPPGSPVPLLKRISTAQGPSITAAGNGVLHLVWADSGNGSIFEIFYKRYLPGIGWGHDKRFTRDNRDHSRPVAATGIGATLNVAWEDFRDGNSEIYFRQTTPELGWDPSATPLSEDKPPSQTPALALLPDGSMLALWTDARGLGSYRLLARTASVLTPP